MSQPRKFDVVVLGAGAAGLMAAIEAGRRGRRTLVLDHADAIGKKILISGGGRCNFTNLHAAPQNFLSDNPHFVRSALARYTAADFIARVQAAGIPYHEKTLGQLFCDRSARDIVTMLERDAAEAGVRVETGVRITAVRPAGGPRFVVESSGGDIETASVIVATGGLSIPKMGATGFGYELARQFGLRVVEPRPGLVPLVFAPEDRDLWCDLSGVSAEIVASVPSAPRRRTPEFREKLLITHRGVSGPAALQISSYWTPGEPVLLDLAPGHAVFSPNGTREAATAATALRAVLPGRWAERWLATHTPPQRILSNAAIAQMEESIHRWSVVPAGTEGYAKAEVTAGGVDTAALDPRTLEARAVPGLFFIGEVVDVTGWLGGYNFQWAWSSGFCAGSAA